MMEQPKDSGMPETAEMETPFSVGRTLREGRERLGMSIADVSGRIKFAPRQIEAIEADDFRNLPEAAFVRGFVRSYARALGIDDAPLLAALTQKHELPVAAKSAPLIDTPFPGEQSERKQSFLWVSLALLVAFLLILFAFLNREDEPSQAAVATDAVEQPLPLPVLEAVPAPMASQVEAASGVLPTSAVEPSAASAPLAGNSAQLESGAKAFAVTTAPAKTADGGSPIHIVVNDDTWIEVKDQTGKVLFAQRSQRGSELWLNGKAPFSVLIKKANGARLYYHAKEIDLASHTSAGAARLVLE